MRIQQLRWGTIASLISTAALAAIGVLVMRAQESGSPGAPHAECTFFGAQRNQFAEQARQRYRLSALTEQVASRLGRTPVVSRMSHAAAANDAAAGSANLIDKYIFAALKDAGVTPADKADDYTFIRRVYLDLTGRIPTAAAVQAFVNDPSPDKRSKLVDALLARRSGLTNGPCTSATGSRTRISILLRACAASPTAAMHFTPGLRPRWRITSRITRWRAS